MRSTPRIGTTDILKPTVFVPMLEQARSLMEIPTVSHFVFGLLGGIAYVLVQLTYGNKVRPVEYISRPFLGGVLAILLTIALGLPNHTTSFFVGYFCIDALDAILAFGSRKIGFKLPESVKNEPKEMEREVRRRVEVEVLASRPLNPPKPPS